ncbi:hypothetical protein D3867_17765 (plasmid) [Azospirillum argentinense]|uniref:Uncharacterized protein n=1 Tax=Azospirillum brasilense TaxID=192 RepID=A0A4D8Q268_AZOBR|nr:hypothetical protein D3867_17765 [Azospirillum argentinense]
MSRAEATKRGGIDSPLPPREREGTRAKRGKGEHAAKDRWFDPRTTLTRPLCGHPLPGRERELTPTSPSLDKLLYQR